MKTETINKHDIDNSEIIANAIGKAMKPIVDAIKKMDGNVDDVLLMIHMMTGAMAQHAKFISKGSD